MSQLLWNERGQIGCTKPGHAPFPGTDTYCFERWEPLDEETAKGDGLRCEVCAARGRRQQGNRREGRPATATAGAEYARLRALLELRLVELRAALDRHEAARRESELLVQVEADLAALVRRVDAAR